MEREGERMNKVECSTKITVFEVDGGEAEYSYINITSHWSSNRKINITFGGTTVTVFADDILNAINAVLRANS